MLKSFQAIICVLAACSVASVAAAAVDFTGSQWIWVPNGRAANGFYPEGNVTLRRDLSPPAGKIPLSANILIIGDDSYSLYVNGQQVGAGSDYTWANRYCARLVPGANVFAVNAFNLNGAAGVLAAIQIRYTDGSTQTIVSDNGWRAVIGVPANFQQIGFDDSAWSAAFVEGPYPTTGPWNTVNIPTVTQDPGTNLKSASWIWTSYPDTYMDYAYRPFRKAVSIPNQSVDSAVIDIVSWGAYSLYINGLLVGSGSYNGIAQRYEVVFPPTSEVVIAVLVLLASPGTLHDGLLVSAELKSNDCGSGTNLIVNTDATWKSDLSGGDIDFHTPGYDASAWAQAVVVGPYGYQAVTLPTTDSPPSAALGGAPSGPSASVVG